ncbi:MAG: DegQ family serine endoprotease [Rhizobiaceae bacterium]
MAVSPRRISRLLGVLVMLAVPFTAALAEDSVRDQLKGALDTMEAIADGAKRVPFGREEMQLSFAPLVKRTAPGVVNVYASSKAPPRSPFMGDPFFDRFFGGGMPPRVQSSLGSGVIVDASGIVVTNFHVIRGADEVKVALADGREFESRILIQEESIDLAVLKIEGEDFPAIELGDSDRLEVGDLVLAIGNPFGVGQTTTSGIVSALARSHLGINDFGFFIQTDAAINPGNSGGALIDMSGRLVGINTAIYSRSGGSNGIGFAIPSNMVRGVIDAARSGSDFVDRPWIGAGFDAVTSQMAEALGMERPTGALVSDVTADGPADRAGLRPGDVVLMVDGVSIPHPEGLGYRLATRRIGEVAAFEVLRRGKTVSLDINLEKAPEGASAKKVSIDGRSPFAGSTVAELSPALARRLGMPENKKGVAIVEIARNSPAHQFGLRPGDIVRELNGEEIGDAGRLAQLAGEQTRWWRFSIERDGRLLRQTLRY